MISYHFRASYSPKTSFFQDFWQSIGWNSVIKNWIFQQKAEYSKGYTVIPAYPGNKLTIKEWFLTISTHKIYLNSLVLAFWQNISWNSMNKNRPFQQTSGCFKGYTDILEVLRRQTYFRKMISNPHCNALPIKPTKKAIFQFSGEISVETVFLKISVYDNWAGCFSRFMFNFGGFFRR